MSVRDVAGSFAVLIPVSLVLDNQFVGQVLVDLDDFGRASHVEEARKTVW